MQKIRVLLVDDHKMVRDGIKSIMKKENKIDIIGEADNGITAIEFLKKEHENVDLIIMDISMPRLNGIETTKIITNSYENIQVLAFTMFDEGSDILKMIEAGASGYITKSAGKEEIINAINAIAKGKKYYGSKISATLINAFVNETESRGKKNDIGLTKREEEVLNFVSKGLTNIEMANKLSLSQKTIESHKGNIFRKFGVKNTASLISRALKIGVIE